MLFSLFVAVLLLNFGLDEDEKMPLQKEQYDSYHKRKHHHHHASIVDTQAIEAYERAEGKAVTGAEDDLVVRLEEAANVVTDEDRNKMKHKSLFIFFLNHPVRLFCAQVEHISFESPESPKKDKFKVSKKEFAEFRLCQKGALPMPEWFVKDKTKQNEVIERTDEIAAYYKL